MKTTRGEEVLVISNGSHNHNQGPDFLLGKVKIGSEILLGNIEIHIDNKDWYIHKHDSDPKYNNVILHVVYESTEEIYTLTEENGQIPILCLKPAIDPSIWSKIQSLIESKQDIPCKSSYILPQKIHLEQFKSRLFSDRLIRKSAWIRDIISNNNNDYETAFYQALLYGFGIKVNSEIFLAIAESLPQRVLAKNIDSILRLEALFLGQANLIHSEDPYAQRLETEYNYLKKLHNLRPISMQPLKSKMLPSSFPTIRLVQFASFVFQKSGLFSKLISFQSIDEIRSHFHISVSEYWQEHYDFGKKYPSKKTVQISDSFFEKLLINVILPFRFLMEVKNDRSTEFILDIYSQLHPEINVKTKAMTSVFGFDNQSAFDSQSYNEWYSFYCLEKKCLECPIGFQTLKSKV